jgi:hypothetical protein
MIFKKLIPLGVLALALSGCSSFATRDANTLPPTAADLVQSQLGVVELRYFNNISVSSVDQLMTLGKYPDSPDEVLKLDALEVSQSNGDRYGSLVMGYIIPKTSGNYRFFIAGDDGVQFGLSTTFSADDVSVLASFRGWTQRNEFTKFSSQVSSEIKLNAGQRYYFEIRHHDVGGGDHFAVHWEGPGISRSVIDGQYLASPGQYRDFYPVSEAIERAYSQGYRVGFFDGEERLVFNPAYPPLDQDQDGLYDNWEVARGLNPTDGRDANADNDSDLLTNYDEFELGSDPSNADSDGDGIPDGVEFAYGLDPLNSADALADFDNDGFSNLEEYQAATDPSDGSDIPAEKAFASRIAGISAQYFTGTNFAEFVMARQEADINFNWERGSPDLSVPNDKFSARFSTQFTAPHSSGTRAYQVVVQRDDGVRFDFDGQRIIDQWRDANTRNSIQITALAGQSYPVNIEYYENLGAARLIVQFIDTVTGEVQNQAEVFSVPDYTSRANQSIDSDSDGVPDYWEYQQGTNAFAADSSIVNNTSGISNLEAFKSGLNPWTLDSVEVAGDISPSTGSSQTPPPVVTPNQASVTISWVAPLTRIGGQSLSLSDIQGYELSYGKRANALDAKVIISGAETSHTLEQLEAGTWYFQMRAFDFNDVYSAPTEVVEHTVR